MAYGFRSGRRKGAYPTDVALGMALPIDGLQKVQSDDIVPMDQGSAVNTQPDSQYLTGGREPTGFDGLPRLAGRRRGKIPGRM